MSAFLAWIGQLPPLAQIPIVIVAFLAVIAVILFFIEIAPRQGKKFTYVRLAACVLFPAIAFLALGSIPAAAVVAAVLGGAFFLLDYRSKQGAGYLFQLVGFLTPAIFLLLIGLIYPTIATTYSAFFNGRGTQFVGLENFQWILNGPGLRVVLNTICLLYTSPSPRDS